MTTEAARAPDAAPGAPRPRFSDHVRVAGLLLGTVLGVVPFLLHLLAAPVATPVARARLRRRLRLAPPETFEPEAVDPARAAGRTVFVVAGEPSGDRLAARVVAALLARAPGVRVRGYAGPETARAGAALDRDLMENAVVGFVAVARTLGFWWRLCAETLARLREDPPDVLLTVDFPGLNLRLARWARRRGVATVHLVAPQTWAWAPWRVARVRRAVDLLLVAFPFEEAVFRDAGVRARYVGHPLFEAPLPPPASPEALPARDVRVELRPGSRRREVRRQAPLVLAAAEEVSRRFPSARFVVRLASRRSEDAFRALLASGVRAPESPEVRVGRDASEPPLDLAITTSGTSTTELAVAQVPMAVFYRASPLARLAARVLVTSPWIAMPNLLAGREVVSERLVGARGASAIAADALRLLEDPVRWAATRADLGRVREALARPAVADRVARAVLSVMPASTTPAA